MSVSASACAPEVAGREPQVFRPGWTSPSTLISGLLHHRELVVTLARKDFFVRYRRASFGLLWSVALPLFQGSVIALVLSRFARFDVGVHYAVYVIAGQIGWSFFSGTLSAAATAVVDGASLSSRIYFPRAVLPLAAVGAGLYALAAGVVALVMLTLAVEHRLGLEFLLVVPAGALLALLAVGFGLTLSALHVYFRDIRYVVGAALMAWFYVTPIFYPISFLHGAVADLVKANPVTAPAELLHLAVGAHGFQPVTLATSAGWAVVLIAVGLVLHCRYDRVFADLL